MQSVPDELRQPIIIVGSPRSGTTLLGKLLRHHPDVTYLEEPRLVWRYGNDDKSDLLRARDARPEVVRYIQETFARRVREGSGKRLLEKTPSNALRLPFVDRVFPDAKFVHILRDGYQSVLSIRRFWQQHAGGLPKAKLAERAKEISLRRAPYYAKEVLRRALPGRWGGQPIWGPRLPGIDALLRDLDLLEVCCLQWRMCVEAACLYGRSLPTDRYFECRLEDMSLELLREILAFARLEEAEQVSEAFHREFDPSQPSRRTPGADPAELEQIRQWIEPTTTWLGFS